MSERWKPIPGYEGLYDVSTTGNVRSYRAGAGRGMHIYTTPQTQLCPATTANGYRRVSLTDATGERRNKVVHRLVLLAFVGPAPNGHECCHRNGIPADNHLENLRWDTRSENNIDSTLNGTRPHQKLKLHEVLEIRTLLREGNVRHRAIAEYYGIGMPTARDIGAGRGWRRALERADDEGLILKEVADENAGSDVADCSHGSGV